MPENTEDPYSTCGYQQDHLRDLFPDVEQAYKEARASRDITDQHDAQNINTWTIGSVNGRLFSLSIYLSDCVPFCIKAGSFVI